MSPPKQRIGPLTPSYWSVMSSFTWWLLLLGAALSHLVVAQEQPLPDEEDDASEDNIEISNALKKAQGNLIRSLIRRIEEEQSDRDSDSPGLEWISKRQHPGKRLLEEVEKRQHPGKREEGDWYMELSKRQHPGRRSTLGDQFLDNSIPSFAHNNDVSKRQHPGKRNLAYTKRQHPGKRSWDDDEYTEMGDFQDVEKRQHPGKRYLESENFDYVPPCEGPDPFNCSKGNLLLELLDNVNKGRMEEKRQHPGRRSTWEAEVPVIQE
ncbi:thyrotropin releasing hormone isoform X1 [Ranitomeya variabilis]|uniref:thyrotropin releasing hormone isoform X1 n=2 Tax=Ranitomeya variabilis TaxID=490064 RepID=UPI0040570124